MKSIITLLIALALASIVCPLMVGYGLFLVVKYQLSNLMAKPNIKAFLIVGAVALIGYAISKLI